jgi:hypothetical protein
MGSNRSFISYRRIALPYSHLEDPGSIKMKILIKALYPAAAKGRLALIESMFQCAVLGGNPGVVGELGRVIQDTKMSTPTSRPFILTDMTFWSVSRSAANGAVFSRGYF